MMPLDTSSPRAGEPRWHTLFTAADVAVPPVPPEFAERLEPAGEGCFATPQAPADTNLQGMANAWALPGTPGFTWLGWVGHGFNSMGVRVCIGLPEAGFFVERRVSELDEQGPACRMRIEGAFELLGRILQEIKALSRDGLWPPGLRLQLVDDDFRGQRWGWIAADGSGPVMVPSAMAYLDVLVQLDQFRTRTAAAGARA